MAHTWNEAGFFTTIKNVSGGTLNCSFLPPHGRVLASGATYTIFGSIQSALVALDYASSTRKIQGFLNAITKGLIQVTQTPAVILTDTVTGLPEQVKVTSGTIGVQAPTYESSLT